MKPTSNINISVQRDIDQPFDIFHVTTDLSYDDLQTLRIVLKAASQLPVFNRDERHLSLKLIQRLDKVLDRDFGIEATP